MLHMKIYVLESLKKANPKSGHQVYQNLQGKGISSSFFHIQSKRDFEDALRRMTVEVSLTKEKPIIHLDFHGNVDGLGIYDVADNREFMTWTEMRELFRELYVQSGMKSLIAMSSCKGINVAKMVAYGEPCPYASVTGCFESISFPDSVRLYTAFYERVHGGADYFVSCVDLSNSGEFRHMKFIGADASTLFQIAINGYLETSCSDEKLEHLRDQYKRAFSAIGELTPERSAYIDQAFSLEGQRAIVQEMANKFFS